MSDYPSINSEVLGPISLVIARMQENPGYLDDLLCPYKDTVKVWFKRYFEPRVGVEVAEIGDDLLEPSTWDDIALKTREMYSRLEGLRTNDPGEIIQITKAQAALLERLVEAGERAIGHRKSAQFIKDVLGIFEEILTPDQRVASMDRLKDFI